MSKRHPDYGPVDPHAAGRKSGAYGAMLKILAALKPGEETVYHLDGDARCGGSFAAVYDAHEQGTVTLTQRRTGGRLHYLATRRVRR